MKSDASPPGRSFSREAVRGSSWTTVQVAISKAAAASATFFLGFLLQPSDFGVAWFAISVGGLATGLHVLAALDVLLASPKGLFRIAGQIQALAIVTACAEFLVVGALAIILSRVYPDRHGLLALMMVVAARPMADAANVLPMAQLRLNLQYRRISLIDGLTTLSGSMGAIVMAYAGFGAMSIVLPPIAATALRGTIYWLNTGRIFERWSAGKRRKALVRRYVLASFGSYVSGVILILDTTILGAFVTPESLGLFAFANGLSTQINGMVSYQIAGSLHPIFAHLRNDPARQIEGLLRACRLISCILVPVLLVQAAVAAPLFGAVWGGRWDDAVPMFMILSVGQAFVVCQWPASFTLKAQGRFRGYLKLQLVQISIMAASCTVFACLGGPLVKRIADGIGATIAPTSLAPTAVALGGLLIMAVFGPLTLWLACRPARVPVTQVLDTLGRPWAAALPTAVVSGWAVRQIVELQLGRVAEAAVLLVAGAVGCAAGAGAAVCLHQSTRSDAGRLAKALATWAGTSARR